MSRFLLRMSWSVLLFVEYRNRSFHCGDGIEEEEEEKVIASCQHDVRISSWHYKKGGLL